MNRIQGVTIYCTVLVLALTSCARPAPSPTAGPASDSGLAAKISSETLVKGVAEPIELPAGGSGQAIVRVTVQNGYHINANPPTYPYLKATELDVANTEDISVDYIYYPNPLIKKFSFAEKPLHVYEGETPLTIAFNAAKSAKKGGQSISGTLRIQACDDRVCYPPGSIGIVIPITIK